MSLAAGTSLGPYEIVAPLGAGGMGEVYRARDPRLGREVAVKIVLAEVTHDPERLRRFEQEARAASALNHPNLLTVFDFGTHDGKPYLVTELLTGRSVRQALQDGSRIAVRTAVEWTAQVARGLAAAHARGIVHRDLKPENLFVTDDDRVKVLDFGLAKLTLGDEGSLASAATIAGGATASGVILGTAGYMAPEQVRGERADSRADLFSLGCVLYELLGGRRAFSGETAIETLNAILKVDPPSLAELRAEVPPALVRVVERCLDKSPAGRFQSAADLAWALDGVAGATSAAGARQIAAPPSRGSARLRRPAGLIAGVVGVALVGLLVGRGLGRDGDAGAAPWVGERLIGGALLAYCPRPSPDGSLVAFIVVDEEGQSQVALLRPGESRFTTLTSDHSRGPVLAINWSADGRLVYLERAVAGAIDSVPALGGDERVVLEHARQPVPLPDGTLLALRSLPEGGRRLIRYTPGQPEAQPVGPAFAPLAAPGLEANLAAFADGREAIYFGVRREDAGRRGPGLWAIDLATGSTRELAPQLAFPRTGEHIALPAVAADPRTDEALVVVPHGDLHVVTAVSRRGDRPPRPLLHLTATPFALSVDRDGSLLLDQVEVSGSLLRFAIEGGDARRVARFAGSPGRSSAPVELPDGGVLFTGVEGAESRLLVARPGRAPAPFVDVDEETSGPVCLVDDRHVAFLVGPAAARQVAVASFDGRIARRVPAPGARSPQTFVAAGDGRSVLYGAGGKLLVLDTVSGAHRELAAAGRAAIDPTTGELVVPRVEAEGTRIERLDRDGSRVRSYGVRVDLFPEPWSGSQLDRQGRLLLTLGPPESWWVGPGMLDLGEERLWTIPLAFGGDVFTPSWGRDGSVLAIGWEYSMNVWRFRRVGAATGGSGRE